MAANNITFKIGSMFSGEGFQRAQSTVQNLNKDVRSGVQMATQMSGALGGLDTSAMKAATAMSGMLNALVSFNVTAIVTQAAMTALSMYTENMTKKAEELTKRMNDAKAAVDAAFSKSLQGRMSEIKAEVDSISGGFDQLAKQAEALTNALLGLKTANAQGGIAQLQVDKLQAMLDAHSEGERENAEKAYDLLIAQENLTNAEMLGQERIAAATEKYELNKEKISNIDAQLAKLGEERASLEQAMMAAKESSDSHWIEIQAKVNELKNQESELETERVAAIKNGLVLDYNLQKAKSESETAILSATAGVQQAELAQQRMTEAIEARKTAEESAKAAAEEKVLADKNLANQTNLIADLQKEMNESRAAVQKAEADYARAMTEYNKNFVGHTIDEAFQKMFASWDGLKGGMFPVDVKKSVQNTVFDKTVDDAIRNGLVNTVAEADRMARDAARQARDQLNIDSGQRGREWQAYMRIRDTNAKARSTQDQAFMDKYEMMLEAQRESKEKVEAAKVALEDAKEREKQAAIDIQAIKQKLDGLGLK